MLLSSVTVAFLPTVTLLMSVSSTSAIKAMEPVFITEKSLSPAVIDSPTLISSSARVPVEGEVIAAFRKFLLAERNEE